MTKPAPKFIAVPLIFATIQLTSISSQAQQFEPGYIDPYTIIEAATAAIGADRLSCVSISGTAYSGMVGQQHLNGYDIDWPRGAPLRNYSRIIDWQNVRMLETFDREPGNNPASWKYGLGWQGGTAIQQQTRQEFMLNGDFAWHKDGSNANPVAAPTLDAERWQLDMWLTPHGFLKAALLPGANPVASWRWELGEMGRDGATVSPEKVSIISITVMDKYRVDATVNSQNLLQRIHTWVPDPVLGDTNYEHEFSNDDYIDIGDGILFPTTWHHHTGWDDNYQAQSINAGHNAFGGKQSDIQANVCPGNLEIPSSVQGAQFETSVEIQSLADGVWLFGGASHNSVVIEFEDYITVIEAPLSERRNLQVIDEIVRLIPDKPIRFLVNTHQHHDHIAGLRTYMHIGATIITHWKNYDFYTNDVLNYSPRTLMPDQVSLWPPTELAEGYQYETVRENYVLMDDSQRLHLSYVHPLNHVEGMLVAYLPDEKILIEADLFNPGERQAVSAANRSLYTHVQRLNLEVDSVVPIHGQPVPWDDFLDFLGEN
jgi:glyoxylase-like metal-dependent hydrolase (beta-lactamase superfamily II)